MSRRGWGLTHLTQKPPRQTFSKRKKVRSVDYIGFSAHHENVIIVNFYIIESLIKKLVSLVSFPIRSIHLSLKKRAFLA